MGGQNFKNPIISKVNFIKRRYLATFLRKIFDLKFRTLGFDFQIKSQIFFQDLKSNQILTLGFDLRFDLISNQIVNTLFSVKLQSDFLQVLLASFY